MPQEFFLKVRETAAELDHFVLATVIAVRGSSSAKPGSKAIIHPEGRNLWGWIGGGCAESFIIEQAVEALAEKQPRVVTVDLDDELLGVGMPCGGYMDVYLEPVLPPRRLLILGNGPFARALCTLAVIADHEVSVAADGASREAFPLARRVHDGDPSHFENDGHTTVLAGTVTDDQLRAIIADGPSPLFMPHGAPRIASERVHYGLDLGAVSANERALALLASLLAFERGTEADSLSINDKVAPALDRIDTPRLLVVGRGRISEELARLASLLGWACSVNSPDLSADDYPATTQLILDDLAFNLPGAGPESFVVIASQHKGDHTAARQALAQGVPYIGLIASKKRAGLVFEWLQQQNIDHKCVHAPAGLDLGAITPFDIALSIVCQIMLLRRGT